MVMYCTNPIFWFFGGALIGAAIMSYIFLYIAGKQHLALKEK